MSGTPAVSVVIPTYNAPGLLMETLGSVFAQTFTDYEVVVVNDGSTDDTAEVLRPLAEAGKIRLETQVNGGIGVARNRGIDLARGKYVALLDHDDLWMPEKLRVQTAYMEAHPECAGCGVRWANSDQPERETCDFSAIIDARGHVVRPMRAMTHGVFIMSSSMMFDREKAAGARFETRRKCIEDTPFHVRLFARGPFGIAGDEILMVYRLHGGNSSSEADFFYNGIGMLRRMDREGAFAELKGADRADMLALFAHLGRTAWSRQVSAGRRGRALGVYGRELGHQVAVGGWRFLAGAPILSLVPARWMERFLARARQ